MIGISTAYTFETLLKPYQNRFVFDLLQRDDISIEIADHLCGMVEFDIDHTGSPIVFSRNIVIVFAAIPDIVKEILDIVTGNLEGRREKVEWEKKKKKSSKHHWSEKPLSSKTTTPFSFKAFSALLKFFLLIPNVLLTVSGSLLLVNSILPPLFCKISTIFSSNSS